MPTATGNDTAEELGQKPTASCEGRLRRLEPDAGKLACPVLRGAGRGDMARLPDTQAQQARPLLLGAVPFRLANEAPTSAWSVGGPRQGKWRTTATGPGRGGRVATWQTRLGTAELGRTYAFRPPCQRGYELARRPTGARPAPAGRCRLGMPWACPGVGYAHGRARPLPRPAAFVVYPPVASAQPGGGPVSDHFDIWSDRASPFPWADPRRVRRPGVPFEALPPVGPVLVSDCARTTLPPWTAYWNGVH
jgi:hypothetical protein